MEIRVTTQQELDEALARPGLTYSDDEIIIDSPRGVWLELSYSKGLDVRASGSSGVRAYGLSVVCASGSSTVEAYGLSVVCAQDSANVWAYDSSRVWARDSSTVDAYGSSSVWVDDLAAVCLHSKDATATCGVLSDM